MCVANITNRNKQNMHVRTVYCSTGIMWSTLKMRWQTRHIDFWLCAWSGVVFVRSQTQLHEAHTRVCVCLCTPSHTHPLTFALFRFHWTYPFNITTSEHTPVLWRRPTWPKRCTVCVSMCWLLSTYIHMLLDHNYFTIIMYGGCEGFVARPSRGHLHGNVHMCMCPNVCGQQTQTMCAWSAGRPVCIKY